jgi:putative aldouronate transport system permease protein
MHGARGLKAGDVAWRSFVVLVTGVSAFISLYPILYTFSMSISSPAAVLARRVWLLPVGFSLESYKLVFRDATVLMAYYNTIWYTVVGTVVNVILTMLAAYPLTRKGFRFRRPILFMITFTMFFSGGLVPLFILVSRLGLYDTRWAMVVPFAVSAWFILVARTYLAGIPESLMEAAKIDGAGELTILWRIITPLSGPIIATLTLYYAVDHWNDYFSALIFLQTADKYPIQVFLYRTLILQSQQFAQGLKTGIQRSMAIEQFKYAAIIVSVLPILCIYPFLQRYFVQGVMVGGIKE